MGNKMARKMEEMLVEQMDSGKVKQREDEKEM